MKKNFQILLLTGIFVSFMGCKFEEENIFDDSSANRIEKAKKEYAELLCSSSNGWVMEYFPTDDQIGYTFLMKFFETGEVKMLAKNKLTKNKSTNDSCLFEFTSISGPVLTFNSYSEKNTFHILSTPEDIPGTEDSEQGIGYGGDYEFIVMKTEENSILLKGLKRKVYIQLRRLAEDQDWEDYFTLLDKMDAALFNVNVPQLQLTVNDSLFTLSGGVSHIFKIVPNGGDPITDGVDMPFIVTDYGIRFVKPFETNNLSVQTFKLSDDKNSLICTDENVNAKIEVPFPADFFFDVLNLNKNLELTTSNTSNMSSEVKAVYDKISQSMLEKKRTLRMISISKSKTWNTFLRIRASANGTDTDVYFSYSFDRESENEISLAFNGFNSQTDPNSKTFYDQFVGIDDLLNLLEGKFIVSIVGSTLIPNEIKLTSVSKPNIWIVLSVK